jgi:hypothetical protein
VKILIRRRRYQVIGRAAALSPAASQKNILGGGGRGVKHEQCVIPTTVRRRNLAPVLRASHPWARFLVVRCCGRSE